MPTYEYLCMDCQRQYEKREGFDAPPLQECPNCGGTARRMIHATPIVFKGSGFYATDSRKTAPEAESQAKVETKADSTPSDGAASKDSKPAPADTSAASS